MKQLLALLLCWILWGCDKKEVNTDLAAEVQGVYEVYSVSNGDDVLALPDSGLSMQVALYAIDGVSCRYVLTVNTAGNLETDERVFYLRRIDNRISFYEDGLIIGFVKDGQLELSFVALNGTAIIMKARK